VDYERLRSRSITAIADGYGSLSPDAALPLASVALSSLPPCMGSGSDARG
jgi:hypothetical protein